MPAPVDPSGLKRAELEARVVELLGELTELKRIVAAQRDEIARLKGLKGRPSIKPSGMENATEAKPGGKRARRRGRGKVRPRVAPETKVLQVVRLLIDEQDDFLAETREVLRAGLETAEWVSVDDTGARHRGANAVCTQIGNDTFAWFGTTGSKSRLVSRPEDSHLRPLVEPGVRLSPHRAPIRQRNLSYRVPSARRGRDIPVPVVQGTARPWSCDPCSA